LANKGVMKLERTGSPPKAARSAPVSAQAETRVPGDASHLADAAASILGIPANEVTPSVRDGLTALLGEVEDLRSELRATRERLQLAEKNADRDQLLPLLNRRGFMRQLTRYISFADRYGTAFSLIYFDLNQFKLVNDAHGHAGGDAALLQLANVLLANVRETDIVGRVGGDEFAILLSHADQAQAHHKADQLAEQVRTSPAVWNGQTIAISFAYGAFELKADDDPEAAMARADEAMYAHKRGAR
jgi:diguanylate cyclase (GGDEF)-like protein